MREFPVVIREAFNNGLRPDRKLNRNKEFLTEAFNAQVTEYGLESYKSITDPFSGSQSVSWPHPQLFIGEAKTLLADASAIKEVNMSVNPWTVSQLTTYDGRDPSSTKAITGSGIWHFIDMKDNWFLLNGSSIVFKTSHRSLQGRSDKVLVIDDTTINTGIYHRGRIILGGFDISNFWNDNWQKVFEAWKESVGEQIPFAFDDIGSNYVMWSSIGGGDFPLFLFYPEIAMEGFMESWSDEYSYQLQESMILESLKKGEFGFMPMPWQGTIQKLVPMGKNIIVYGDEGTAMLYPADVGYGSTYGLQNMKSVGAVSRGAAEGQLFIDKSGVLWSISGEEGAQRLGFSEYLFDLIGNDIIISKEDHFSSYYISDGNETFVFDRGLSQIQDHPTSVTFRQGGLVGLFTTDNDDELRIESGTFDLNIRGSKRITAVALGVDTSSNLEVAVDYRTSKDGSFTRSPWFPVNAEGVSYPIVTGLEFKLVIKSDNYADVRLDYAEVRYEAEDKRYIRGTRSSQNVT